MAAVGDSFHSVSLAEESYDIYPNGREDGFGTELYDPETIFQEKKR